MTGGATDDEKHELKRVGSRPTPTLSTAETPTPLSPKGTTFSSQDDAKRPVEQDDSDSDTAQEDEVAFRLRELANDEELSQGYKREHWWQIWRSKTGPPPPRKTLAEAPDLPLATANIFSVLSFHWVSPIMRLGYQRPLQATDLWKMDATRESDHLSNRFLTYLHASQDKADEWNRTNPDPQPKRRTRLAWKVKAATRRRLPQCSKYGSDRSYSERLSTLQKAWSANAKRHGNIALALFKTFPSYWWAGVFKVLADTTQLMSPLVIKALIRFSQQMYAANNGDGEKPNIGRGVGMAIGLFCLTIVQSVCQHQFFFRSMETGALARAALISATYKQALKLSVGARSQHPNGKLMAYLSSDISRIDYCGQWLHCLWTTPIQLIICLILLIIQIGPSALVGFAVFFLLAPVQTNFMKTSFRVRKRSMKWTDGRSSLLQELLVSMQIIKVFTYELPFLKRLRFIRKQEMKGIRIIHLVRTANQAVATSVPAIAAVLAFVTYTSYHDRLDPALIFTSLAYFNYLRQPLMMFPRALSSLTDAQTAIERLESFFEAETTDVSNPINPNLDVAVRAQGATFQWASVRAPDELSEKANPKGKKGRKGGEKAEARPPPSEKKPDEEPFKVENLNLNIPRGQLVAIVGPVGAGKSSILQGLLGEMRKLNGDVAFGGVLGYCQQSAWIQNATLRDNIIFGQKWDESRYWRCIRDASLITDLEILPDGDLTEIGEKGVNLSGGQKQRVNIARALYFDADIVLFDDPLSAVDAHVGKALFNDAILGLKRAGKTVVLVTHALHFLPNVDYVYTIEQGRVVEEGTYDALIAQGGAFKRLMTDFGGSGAMKEEKQDAEEESAIEDAEDAENPKESDEEKLARLAAEDVKKAAGSGKLEGRLMVSEVRKTGSVEKKVYAAYLRAGRAWITLPLLLISATLMQASQVLSTVWLTYWEVNRFGRPNGFYQGIYAMFGVSQAIFTFAMGACLGMLCYYASNHLFRSALQRVFFAPMSFFDTQPLGRIMGVFGKDIDTVDTQLAEALRMQTMTLAMLLGSIVIITVYFHYFIAIIFVVGCGYWYFAQFYRTSAREVKRLDSMLRSLLYAHFSESLSGLATIRAYGETDRFVHDNSYYMDLEDRAYVLTYSNQRWLAIRLDALGALLVFAVAIMSAAGGGGLKPSEIALCLTYMTQITQMFGMVTRQSAEVENAMNAVERMAYYSDGSLPQEAAYEVPDTAPGSGWPQRGAIKLENVVMAYRPGLPPVLKGISAEFEPGEKVGIIGRTGAGKTSITVALFRLAELESGRISIDGVDTSTLGLRTLRSRVAIIPQDPVLFSGTLRSNLDPFDEHSDAELYDAMQRASLVGPERIEGEYQPGPGGETQQEKQEEARRTRFTLDMAVDEEGSNLSVGERSLVSLARALVKDSPIVILDEATASVDLLTDAKIQSTIRREFAGKTLLCIAHRLRTIISWDRILVMNAGEIEDFDTPLNLFDKEGLFRAMCARSNITRDEIVQARQHERFEEQGIMLYQ